MSESVVKIEKVLLSNGELERIVPSLIQLLNVKEGISTKTKYRLGNIKKQIMKINEDFGKFVREEVLPKYAKYDENGELEKGEIHPMSGETLIVFKSEEDEKACNDEMNKLKEEEHELSFVRIPFSVFEDERVNNQINGNLLHDLEIFIEIPEELKF